MANAILYICSMIHPSALVSSQAEVSPEAFVGPWCIVDAGAKVAAGVRLEARVHVNSHVEIGENTAVFDGAVLGAPPQDLKYGNEPTRLIIGKNCTIREYCTLNRGTVASGYTEVGDDALLMAYVHVAHDCRIGEGAVVSNGCQLGGHVRIGEYATIGGTAGVAQRCCIGAYSFVGASLKVDRDVPPAVKALGNPLKFAGLNLHALRRFPEIFSEERIVALEKSYRQLYRSASIEEALHALLAVPETDVLLHDFFGNWQGRLITR